MSVKFKKSALDKKLAATRFSERSKRAIRYHLVDGLTLKASGEKAGGMSKQHVWALVNHTRGLMEEKP